MVKETLYEQYKREYEYLKQQKVGTEEYNNSRKRMHEIELQIAEIESSDSSSKDRKIGYAVDIGKTVFGFVGSVGLTLYLLAKEENIPFNRALQDLSKFFLRRK